VRGLAVRRAARPVLIAATLVAGCGEVRIGYGDQRCLREPPPGVVVEFIAKGDGTPVAVGASGLLRDGAYLEQMTPLNTRPAAPGSTYALAGGFAREGIYDIQVQTSFGEVVDWSRIKVAADDCGPFTVVLQAQVSLF
jgi:hypothetical protein